MRSFEVPGTTPNAFIEEMRFALAAKQYDRYVDLDLEGENLVVELRWMGTTEFTFRIRPARDGFRAEFVDQRVAPFHRAFSDRFESYFDNVLAKVGAKSV